MPEPTLQTIMLAPERLRADVNAVRQEQVSFRKELTGLHEEQVGFRKEQAKLLEEYTCLRTDLMARLDRLPDSLTLARDDIVVNFGASDRIENIARSASNEVRALALELGGLRRQVQHLQSEVRALRGEP